MTKASADVGELADEVLTLKTQLYRALGIRLKPKPGPPASEAALAKLESRAGLDLPPSYRAFLAHHDGWTHYEGQMALCSVREQTSSAYKRLSSRWIRALQADNRILDPYVWGMRSSLLAYPVLVFDRARCDSHGEMPILFFQTARERPRRYTSLVDMFRKQAREMRSSLSAC